MKNKLQIVLITYNRKEYLKNTLDSILVDSSPIKDFDITILDNCSTDGTSETIQEYTSIHKNITHIKNKINIGGNANICKAFVECSNKEYIWVLADNDKYNFNSWNEIETAINNDYDVIMTVKCNQTPSEYFHRASLISGVIYRTKNITSTVVENMYDNICNLFPHLAIMAKNINDNNSIYFIKENIVIEQINPEHNTTFIRGINPKELPKPRRNMFWSIGYFNTLELIKDKKIRQEIIDGTRHFHKSLLELFISICVKNKYFCNNYPYNFYRIFRHLNFTQKIKFIMAFLIVNFSFKDYSFYNTRQKDEWIEYLKKVDEKKYIDKLAKKLKNKKVLLYGAGMFFDILSENYDLSQLNVIGISDKKFEYSNEKSYKNIPIVKPDEIKEKDFDCILFTLKLFKQIETSFQKQRIDKKMYSLIKSDRKFVIRK